MGVMGGFIVAVIRWFLDGCIVFLYVNDLRSKYCGANAEGPRPV